MTWDLFVVKWENVIQDVTIRVGFTGDMDEWILNLYLKGPAVSKIEGGKIRRVYSAQKKNPTSIMNAFADDCVTVFAQYGLDKEG